MSALVQHFGDSEDAERPCGKCDVCDPAAAVLRQFRRATAAEHRIAQQIVGELRAVSYKATGALQKSLDLVGRIGRKQFDDLLAAMVHAGIIEIEEDEFEKNGEIIRFRKARLTKSGHNLHPTASLTLLVGDDIVEEFKSLSPAPNHSRKARAPVNRTAMKAQAHEPLAAATPETEQLAARLRKWRTAEAKRLGVPAYVVLHDRSLSAVALTRPANPAQLVAIAGIGPAKAEKFGAAILQLCAAETGLPRT
jgi:superfamily II DNA helicase RecQ